MKMSFNKLFVVVLSVFLLVGCGSKKDNLIGEWTNYKTQIQDFSVLGAPEFEYEIMGKLVFSDDGKVVMTWEVSQKTIDSMVALYEERMKKALDKCETEEKEEQLKLFEIDFGCTVDEYIDQVVENMKDGGYTIMEGTYTVSDSQVTLSFTNGTGDVCTLDGDTITTGDIEFTKVK